MHLLPVFQIRSGVDVMGAKHHQTCNINARVQNTTKPAISTPPNLQYQHHQTCNINTTKPAISTQNTTKPAISTHKPAISTHPACLWMQ
jgi:hypothetical protein